MFLPEKLTPENATMEILMAMPFEEAIRRMSRWSDNAVAAMMRRWTFWQRTNQMAPPEDWHIWLVMAGRGFGKTRMGAEWVHEMALAHPGAQIAIVGATYNEARAVMVEGHSGVMNPISGIVPVWEPSLRRASWPNGSAATLYSAAEPESFRGPQHHFAWADEIAKWPYGKAAWDNMMMGLRLGNRPRVMATTTPRNVELIRDLVTGVKDARRGIAIRSGRTVDNAMHLAASFIEQVTREYGGTRLGRQELSGELIADAEGALWKRDLIEGARIRCAPELTRVVIGVDPPVTSHGDACGIVVAGLGRDGRAYVLADHSVRGKSPEGWARSVADAAARWRADRVVAESNQGGEMVAATLRAAQISLPLRLVHASRGKLARAEPVTALYEAGRVRHAGMFPELEDELCGLITGGGYEGPGRSPDRADAMIWAMHELMLRQQKPEPRVRMM